MKKLTILLFVFVACKNSPKNNSFVHKNEDAKAVELIEVDTEIIELVHQIDGYTKVNDAPQQISVQMDALCAMSDPNIENQPDSSGPHEMKTINVFVNNLGESAMTTMGKPVFPTGTVIIKEKFRSLKHAYAENNVELYTIMIKREKGYNPTCGDWEFAAVNGSLNKVERGKLSSCMACHTHFTENDYVFRDNYLAYRYRKALK